MKLHMFNKYSTNVLPHEDHIIDIMLEIIWNTALLSRFVTEKGQKHCFKREMLCYRLLIFILLSLYLRNCGMELSPMSLNKDGPVCPLLKEIIKEVSMLLSSVFRPFK